MVAPAAKREAVAHLREAHQVSERRVCAVLGVDRSSVRYRSVRPDDAHLRPAMKAVAAERSSIEGAIGSSPMDNAWFAQNDGMPSLLSPFAGKRLPGKGYSKS